MMDVDWCLPRELLTSKLSSLHTNPLQNGPYKLSLTFPSRSPKSWNSGRRRTQALDLIQSQRTQDPHCLVNALRRPLGKSPALVMTQYSMNSHIHLRHLRSSHILDRTLRSMRSPIQSTIDPITSQILNLCWTLKRSSPYGPCLMSAINVRKLLVTEDSHTTATFLLNDRKP